MLDATGAWPALERTPGPLSGIRVLDLSRVLAGPYAAMLLADLGADVIKIEHPAGDETRRWGPPFLSNTDTAVYYLAMNRNKRSVRADFRDAADASMVKELAAVADVVVENFKPGALAAFGLDLDSVRAANPAVVYCSITGFGSDSEMRDRGGYDLVVQAMGGIMAITGEPDGPPVKVGVASADMAAGMYATISVLAALVERGRTGVGRHVEVALLDAQVASLANQAMNWLAGGLDPAPLGSAHPNVVPYQAFETSDGHIVVAVGSDSQFRSLCDLISHGEWISDSRFATNQARVAHREELVEELKRVFLGRTSSDWLEVLDTSGIPCGPVRSIAQVFDDSFIAKRMVREVDHPDWGTVPQVLSPFRFDGHTLAIDLAPPSLGGDDDAVRAHVARAVGGDGDSDR